MAIHEVEKVLATLPDHWILGTRSTPLPFLSTTYQQDGNPNAHYLEGMFLINTLPT